MDILQVRKKTSSFKGAKLKRKLSLVSFPLCRSPGTNSSENAQRGRRPSLTLYLLHHFVCKWGSWTGSCPSLSTVVCPSLRVGEDAVLAFCSSLLRGDELLQGCRFPPGDGHLQWFHLEGTKMLLSLLSALLWETQQTFTTPFWRGRVTYRNT